MKIRIAKFIADSGVTSRRGAEQMIAEGRVLVNGEVIKTPVHFVDTNDEIKLSLSMCFRQKIFLSDTQKRR